MLFSGRTNAIYLTREYYQDYACPFDLVYYPFDTQVGTFKKKYFFDKIWKVR